MPNVFDQFDGSAASAPPPPATSSLNFAPDQSSDASSGNVFDQFDGPPDNGRPSALTRVAAGANSGLISQTLGMPVDVAAGAMNLVPRTINTLGQAVGHDPGVPLIENPVGGSEWFDTLLGKAGIGTKGIAPPENAGERIEQAAGQGIGGMLAPNVLAKGRALSGILGVSRDVEDTLAAGSVPANAGIGGISGAGGQAGAEVAPDGYQVPAYLLGSLVPGGALAAGAGAASALGRGTANLYRNMPPLRAASREAAASAGAANRVRAAASDPTAAFENLETAPTELVPGSLPTTAELSGDPGLLGAQRFRENNSADFGRETLERRAGNAAAQMSHLEGQAPPLASVEDTQAALRQHLADIDKAGDAAADAARVNAAQALPAASMTPEETGAAARTAVEAERAPQGAVLAGDERRTQSMLDFASDQFGGQEALGSAEDAAAAPARYGAAMREPVAAAYAAEQQRLRNVRDSIDPTGTMGMRPDAMKAAVGKIAQMFPTEGGAQLSGAERNLYDTVSNWGDLIPVERAFQMRANINGRIRGLQGSDPQEALRLGMLKNGVDDALAQAVEHVDVGERAGLIHEGLPGINDRMSGVETRKQLGPSFTQDVARAYASNPATLRAAGRDETGRGILEAANLGDDGLPAGTIPAGNGGRGPRGRGFGDSEGSESLPQEPQMTGRAVDVDGHSLPLNSDGTVTLYHATKTPEAANGIVATKTLKSEGEPSVYFSTAKDGTGYGDHVVAVNVNPKLLHLDDEFPNGRVDFRVDRRSLPVAGARLLESAAPPEVRPGQLTPLDAEARQKFQNWNAGYRQMGQTFRGETPGTLHAVGKILQKGGAYDTYRMTDAEVPWLFVNRGPNARQAVDRFLAAAPEEAHAALDDALAFSLRRAAQKPDGTLDLPKYEAWRRNYGSALSARPELAQKFGNAAQAQRQLDDIRQSLAEHAAEHPLKPGWGDAGLLNRYFKPGPEGAEKMREYQRITGSRAGALAAATDHAAFSFAQAAVRDGQVNPRLAEIWLRQHDEALSAMPSLRDRFKNAAEAQRSVERAIEAHQTARDDFTKSVAGAFIGDDPSKAVARVFSGANREQKAKLLVDLVRGNKAAFEGLQRAAIEYIRSRFEGAAVPGAEVGAIGPKRFGDFVRENRGVISHLFPGKIANFDALAADLKRGAQVQGAKINKAGSDTAELTAGRGEHGEHGGDIGTASMMLLAEHAGQHAGHHLIGGLLGGFAGPIAAVGSLAGKMLLNKAKNSLAIREDQLFDKALLDPQFAAELNRTNPATRHETPESIGARLKGRLVQQSLLSARGAGLQ